MRTTLDIPDAMYRRIRARAAQEDSTVRGITLVLYARWLDGAANKKSFRRLANAEVVTE